jgi:hypothetical protein
MRRLTRPKLVALLALTISLGLAHVSQAHLFRGNGNGIQVAFRVEGRRVTLAYVSARLHCVGPKGRRHLGHYKRNYALPGQPLFIRNGVFRKPVDRELPEEANSQEETLVGRIQGGIVTGRYEYRSSLNTPNRSITCHATTRFRARLRDGTGARLGHARHSNLPLHPLGVRLSIRRLAR